MSSGFFQVYFVWQHLTFLTLLFDLRSKSWIGGGGPWKGWEAWGGGGEEYLLGGGICWPASLLREACAWSTRYSSENWKFDWKKGGIMAWSASLLCFLFVALECGRFWMSDSLRKWKENGKVRFWALDSPFLFVGLETECVHAAWKHYIIWHFQNTLEFIKVGNGIQK